MQRMVTQGARAFLLIGVLLSIVACGGGPGASEEPVAPTAVANDAAPTAVTSAPPASAGESLYAGLPQSKTPAGYYLLGEPTAPVLMQYYSDFL